MNVLFPNGCTMNVLTFDTCFGACSAAVGRDYGTACQRVFDRFEPMDVGQAERLLPLIGEVLALSELAIGDIDLIGVTVGPGTFTGTRIGIAAAKGLALASGIRLVGLSSLAVMARQAALIAPQTSNICVTVDVRRSEVYTQLFDNSGLIAKTEPALMTLDQARRLSQFASITYAGSGANLVVAGLSNKSDREFFSDDSFSSLLPQAQFALDLLSHDQRNSRAIRPIYLRAPDAQPPAPNMIQRH